MQKYDHAKIEKKWQEEWERTSAFAAEENSKKPKAYILDMFPYPSGAGLHVGHVEGYTATDIYSRYKRANGFNVLHPMGWDAFGLPAENYAIKTGTPPRKTTDESIDNFRKQIKNLGLSYDWSREFGTHTPEYYQWTQWLFNKFFEKGLVYKKKALVNWDPVDQTVLANEQVLPDGTAERSGAKVEKKELEQWFYKITDYADELIEGLDKVDWPESTKINQRNWVGRSEGAEIDFPINKKYKFVLLHGYKGGPDRDFLPWLKAELEAQGHEVIVPLLPHSKEENAKETLDMNAAFSATEYDQNTIVVGHSLGCIVALKIAEEYNIGGLVLAGGFLDGQFIDHERPFVKDYDWNIDVNRIKNSTGWIKLLQDTSDDIISIDQAKRLSEKLSIPLELVTARQPHFNSDIEVSVLKAVLPSIKVFTTRPDTLFGATYMVLAPEHPLVAEFAAQAENKDEIEAYVKTATAKSEIDRSAEGKEKTGVEIKGVQAINPATKKEIPVYIADYVLGGYGTGAIMAVPAYDERDAEFAKKFDLPVIEAELADPKKIVKDVGGEFVKKYRLRDWLISRQRYWGAPIPIVYDPEGKPHAVPDEHLPWKLPEDVEYLPKGTSPLGTSKELLERTERIFGKGWRPEIDTMDTFACSSWYFFRFADPHNRNEFASKEAMQKWLPVDLYVGGAEHTVLHLLYARFYTKALRDMGYLSFDEPFLKLRHQGIILAEDSRKMSKRWGNVINPDDMAQRFGADSVRLYEMFMGPLEAMKPWNTNNVMGVRRFLERVWGLGGKLSEIPPSAETETILHQTIEKVTKDIEALKLNTAVSSLMIFSNHLQELDQVPADAYQTLLQLLAPFAPHMASEIAEQKGMLDKLNAWPQFDPSKTLASTLHIAVQVNGRVRATVELSPTATENEALAAARSNSAVAKWLAEGEEKRAVYITGKVINFVVG